MQSINSGKSVGISAKLTLMVGILVVLIFTITSAVSYFDSKQYIWIAKRQSVKNYARCGCFFWKL